MRSSLFAKPQKKRTIESFNKTTQSIDVDEIKDISLREDSKTELKKASAPQYIYKALEKAEERRKIEEDLKNMRMEREIKKWEEQNGELLKFDTITGESNIENINEYSHNVEMPISTKKECYIPTEEEFEQMKQRYLERLDQTDILQLKINRAKKLEILHFPEICGFKVITKDD